MKFLFVGGGHAHEVALDLLPDSFFQKHKVVLINDSQYSLYSGMLPGFLSGKYTFDDIAVDLKEFCKKKNVKFIEDKVTSIDNRSKAVLTKTGHSISFDRLSINVGSTARTNDIEIDSPFAHPVKPIGNFELAIRETLRHSKEALSWLHVGGGTASVEVAIGLHEFFRENDLQVDMTIVESGQKILSSHNSSIVRHFEKKLAALNIDVHCSSRVVSIKDKEITLENGKVFSSDFIGLFTGAAAPKWLSKSGLRTQNGFVLVNSHLNVIDHPHIYAAGDCANFVHQDIPKAGVFAVRQGKVLAQNFLFEVGDASKKEYKPQTLFLSLIADGPKSAALSYGPLFFSGVLIWTLKNYIDKRFMKRFKAS